MIAIRYEIGTIMITETRNDDVIIVLHLETQLSDALEDVAAKSSFPEW